HMTQLQLDAWKKTPLAVNTEPDISKVGNRQVRDMAVRAGCWLRSDSLIMDEPIQIEELGHRPAWLATVNDDEVQSTDDYPRRSGGPMDRPEREVAGFHALDIGTNYFGLWTEADNVRR